MEVSQSGSAPSRADAGSAQTDGEPAEQAPARPILVQRTAAILWLAAVPLAGALIAVGAMIFTGHARSQDEISGLEKIIETLSDEKHLARKQLDELRSSHYAQMIAERRCEVIDGLEDCLKAGLKRPQRFAETDRQFLEARRTAKSQHPEQSTSAGTTATSGSPESGRSEPRHSSQRANGNMSLGEFAQELGKIPGVAVDGNVAEARKGGKDVGAPGTQPKSSLDR